MSWPAQIKDVGTIRNQFHHVIDIFPTILEVTKIPAPTEVVGIEQDEIEGVSMMYTFDDSEAKSTHTQQYFEMMGNRGMYKEGWVAATKPIAAPWVGVPDLRNFNAIDDVEWELYNIDEDFSEHDNLAKEYPEKLEELKELFYEDARKFNVLPIDYSKIDRLDVRNRPSLTAGATEFTFYGALSRIPEGGAPDLKNKDYEITALIDMKNEDSEGVIVAHGGKFTGYSMYVKDGALNFHYNFCGLEDYQYVVSTDTGILGTGEKEVRAKFEYNQDGELRVGNGGTLTLFVDGEEAASGEFERTIGYRMSLDETFDIGRDAGTSVTPVYKDADETIFTGQVKTVTITIDPKVKNDEL